MRRRPIKNIIERYKESRYSEEAIVNLHYLESHCEHLCDFLDGYRHLKKTEEILFSEETIERIAQIIHLEEEKCFAIQCVDRLRRGIAEYMCRIDECSWRIECLERGWIFSGMSDMPEGSCSRLIEFIEQEKLFVAPSLIADEVLNSDTEPF